MSKMFTEGNCASFCKRDTEFQNQIAAKTTTAGQCALAVSDLICLFFFFLLANIDDDLRNVQSLFASVTLISSIGRLEFCNRIVATHCAHLITHSCDTLVCSFTFRLSFSPLKTINAHLKNRHFYRGKLFFHLCGCFFSISQPDIR